MGILGRIFGERRDEALLLYQSVVARARAPHWYIEGAVPDTVDGRFDVVAAVLSLVLIRLEAEPAGIRPGVQLAERFVDDMDPQLREIGIGDLVVGKHVGRMMAALGGRLGAYREALATGDLPPALVRNLYRGDAPAPAALEHATRSLRDLHAALAARPIAEIVAGRLP